MPVPASQTRETLSPGIHAHPGSAPDRSPPARARRPRRSRLPALRHVGGAPSASGANAAGKRMAHIRAIARLRIDYECSSEWLRVS